MQRRSLIQTLLEILVNFMLRGLFGLLCIYFVNRMMIEFQVLDSVEPMISYNIYTFCTSGILGIPGVLLLYGLQFLI